MFTMVTKYEIGSSMDLLRRSPQLSFWDEGLSKLSSNFLSLSLFANFRLVGRLHFKAGCIPTNADFLWLCEQTVYGNLASWMFGKSQQFCYLGGMSKFLRGCRCLSSESECHALHGALFNANANSTIPTPTSTTTHCGHSTCCSRCAGWKWVSQGGNIFVFVNLWWMSSKFPINICHVYNLRKANNN